MKNHFDAIVIGVGSMGAATCYHLAKRGINVLGIDRYAVPHESGSHTGQTRIIRKAYFEHSDYIPMLEKAYQYWYDMEEETGEKLFHKVGLLYSGEPQCEMLTGVRKSADLYGVPIEQWSHKELKNRFPQFTIPHDFEILFEEDAGFVLPEKTISLFVERTRDMGGEIIENTAVNSWRRDGNGYIINTDEDVYSCDTLVISSGAWSSELLEEHGLDLQVTHQPLGWLPQSIDAFRVDSFPCFMVEVAENSFFYGFPDLTGFDIDGPLGLKVALHRPGAEVGPNDPRPDITSLEKEELVQLVKGYFPNASRNFKETKSCLYTYSKDTDFIIDFVPGHDHQLVVATGFSGHGFKFSPAVGASIANMIIDGEKELMINFLGLDRFD